MSPVTVSPLRDLQATYTQSTARLLMLHTNRGKVICNRACILDIWFLYVLILLHTEANPYSAVCMYQWGWLFPVQPLTLCLQVCLSWWILLVNMTTKGCSNNFYTFGYRILCKMGFTSPVSRQMGVPSIKVYQNGQWYHNGHYLSEHELT